MDIRKAIEEMKSLSPSESAIEFILNELNNLQKENEKLKTFIIRRGLDREYKHFNKYEMKSNI